MVLSRWVWTILGLGLKQHEHVQRSGRFIVRFSKKIKKGPRVWLDHAVADAGGEATREPREHGIWACMGGGGHTWAALLRLSYHILLLHAEDWLTCPL